MCFDEKTSLLTYLIGISGSINLYNIKLIPESLFFGWISHMQLIDFVLWKNQPCKISESNKICKLEELKSCNKINQNTTTAGMIINNLEPVIMYSSILLFSKNKLPTWVMIITLFFFICLFIYTIDTINKKNTIEKKCTYVTEQSNPHLFWQWNYNEPLNIPIYLYFVLIFVLLSYYGFSNGGFSSLVILISYIISAIVYKNKKSIGTMWCFCGAFIPWIFFIYEKYFN
jgi:hypothetical protein